MQEIKFDFDDIKLVPADSSVIRSRKSVNVKVHETRFLRGQTLPLMSAPMDSVVSPTRLGFNPDILDDLLNSGIRPVTPRNTQVLNSSFGYAFHSQSLEEVKRYLLEEVTTTNYNFICIDMANGHMAELAVTVRALKTKYPALVLMVGNIANPYTYKILSDAGADYVRCGIGSGSGCFADGTLVRTSDGLKPIEEISTGTLVLSHTGQYRPVFGIVSYFSDEALLLVNGATCTKNHEFYAVHKLNKHLINEGNYKEHAFFIEAYELNEQHLILSWDCPKNTKLVFNEVNKLELAPVTTCLNDLTVADDHSYCVGSESLIVHNCLTTQQTGVGYPMASLIHECAIFAAQIESPAKIVADGGFNKYADIIKALALGADYVMMGGLISKMIESDSVPYLFKLIPIENRRLAQWLYKKKAPLYKNFRGMSTKEVQREWQKTTSGAPITLKTSEGITKWNRVEYSLSGWVENFESYLRSAMSYSNARDLQEFRENSSFVQITNHSQLRFKK